MYMSLFVLGGLLTVAGGVMAAMGIPYNEFNLGNTLIIAGTTAVVGGLLLIGLADAVRQLRRIADGLMVRPGTRVARPAEPFEPMMPAPPREAAPGRIPFPPKPVREKPSRGPAPYEQRLAAAPSLDGADEGFERAMPSFSPLPQNREPEFVPDRDEAPLSPREAAQGRREPHFAFTEVERREMDLRLSGRDTEASPISELDTGLRAPASSAEAQQNEVFDSFWPPESRRSPAPAEPERDMTAAREQEFGAAGLEQPEAEEAGGEPHAVSILKSGVVDGMAYTLYSDGSIEAEMPEGTVRFASITELRAYLEQSS